MNDDDDISHDEKQVNKKMSTETETLSNQSELNSQQEQPNTKEENGIDLNERMDTNIEERNRDVFKCDNEIFGDTLIKIQLFIEKLNETNIEKDLLIDQWNIFNNLFNSLEKNEKNLTDEDLSVIKQGINLFDRATNGSDISERFTTDSDTAQEIFYMYVNLINIKSIQNYLKNINISDSLKSLYRFGLYRIVRVMRNMSKWTVLDVNDSERPTNYIELVSLIFHFVKINLKTLNLTLTPSFDDESKVIQAILVITWEYADKTIMIPDLIKAGCVEAMIDGLIIICKTANVDGMLPLEIISIIHNISRHDDGIIKLNSLNAIDVIEKFRTINERMDLNILCCMTLALLLTPEQIKNDHKCIDSVLDTLLKMVYEASVSSTYRTKDYIHLSELLTVFVKLFNDDRTLNYIMENSQFDLHTPSAIDYFINLFIDFYFKVNDDDPLKQVTCTALVNILWSVSFQQKYKEELENTNPKFIELLCDLNKETDENISSNQYVPQYLESIKRAAEGLLYNIGKLTDSPVELQKNQKPIIMISYSHQNTDFCKQLLNEIEKQGYDTWVDFKFLKTGDLWEQIAAGMKGASAIICLMSEEYCKSKSCRWEATFALDKLLAKKPVIPLLLREHELPDWLDIRIAMLKYIRFKNVKSLETDKLSELVDDLQGTLPTQTAQTDLSLQSPTPPAQPKSQQASTTENKETVSHINNTVSVDHDQSVQPKSNKTNSVNQETTSKTTSVLGSTNNSCTYPNKPIQQWNQDDISQWFQYNDILTELKDLCRFRDGYELMTYAKLFLKTEHLQYQMYCDEFLRIDGITCGQKPLLLHEFTKLSNALRKLQTTKQST